MDGIDIMRARAHKGEPIELLLLDYHMHLMSGIEVARAIARAGLTPKIIALTSNVDSALANEPSILAFCAKPIRRGQLLHMIRSILKAPGHTLPSTPAAAEGKKTPAAVPEAPLAQLAKVAPLTGTCVLLVEDNDTNRAIVGSLL